MSIFFIKHKLGVAFDKIVSFVRHDWHSHRIRFVLEVCGVTCNVIASILLAVTAQDPWLAHVYTLFLIASSILIYTSYLRGSTGFVVLYTVFIVIDTIGLSNTLGAFGVSYSTELPPGPFIECEKAYRGVCVPGGHL